MIGVYLRGHDDIYTVDMMMKLFFPFMPYEMGTQAHGEYSVRVYSTLSQAKYALTCTTCIDDGSKVYRGAARIARGPDDTRRTMGLIKKSFYRAAICATGITPPWGIHTGIRPAKSARELLYLGDQRCEARLRRTYMMRADKAELAVRVARLEQSVIERSKPNGVSLYVSIPFCPARCVYCSFVSQDVHRAGHMLSEYLNTLHDELDGLADVARDLGMELETVYIGGGTPSVLDAEQIDALLARIARGFDLSGLREYTFEAGRADTITREKLKICKSHGVTRICINPQTMDDKLLSAIGRGHTGADVRAAFETARVVGFESINMDLIAGLPGDTPRQFEDTLQQVTDMSPQSITIHTLSVKRGSALAENTQKPDAASARADTGRMLNIADGLLKSQEYAPYYLYRQKNILGGYENTGYCKPGHECLYNIYMMEETQSILGAGAGAVTKLVSRDCGRIERAFAYKYPREYIADAGKYRRAHEWIKKFCSGNGETP